MTGVLMCVKAVQLAQVVDGSSLKYCCKACNARLVISPGSLRLLAAHPELVPTCVECALAQLQPGDEMVPANPDYDREISRPVANPWLSRN